MDVQRWVACSNRLGNADWNAGQRGLASTSRGRVVTPQNRRERPCAGREGRDFFVEGCSAVIGLLQKDVRALTIEGGLPTGHCESHQKQHHFDISPRFSRRAMAGRIGLDFDADFISSVMPGNGRLTSCSADSRQQHAQVATILKATTRFRPR